MELYENIRKRRIELNMTQEELAKKCGYNSRSTINKIELGERNLTIPKIKTIAKALNTTASSLLGNSGILEIELIYESLSVQKQEDLLKYARYLKEDK